MRNHIQKWEITKKLEISPFFGMPYTKGAFFIAKSRKNV